MVALSRCPLRARGRGVRCARAGPPGGRRPSVLDRPRRSPRRGAPGRIRARRGDGAAGEGGCGHGLRRSGSGLSCGPSCGAGRPALQGGRPGPADFPEPPQGHAAPDDLDDPERSPNSDTPRASRARALLHPHRRPHRHEPPQEPPGDRRHGRHRWHAPLGGHARGGGRGGRRATRHGRNPHTEPPPLVVFDGVGAPAAGARPCRPPPPRAAARWGWVPVVGVVAPVAPVAVRRRGLGVPVRPRVVVGVVGGWVVGGGGCGGGWLRRARGVLLLVARGR